MLNKPTNGGPSADQAEGFTPFPATGCRQMMKFAFAFLLSLVALPAAAQLQTWQLQSQPGRVAAADFGLVCNGTTNGSTALQAAVNSLAGSPGADIMLPPGVCMIRQSILNATQMNVRLIGAGSAGWGGSADNPGVTTLVTDQDIYILDFGTAGSAIPGGVHIKNVAFEDRTTNKTALGAMRFKSLQHVYLEDVNCANFFTGYCVHMIGTAGSLDAVQYGEIKFLKARKVKFPIKAEGGSMQMVITGGHFTAPVEANYSGSRGIWLEAGTTARADTWRIINPSIESYEQGIRLIGTIGVSVMARIENTVDASYHNATSVYIAGTANFASRGNTVTMSSLNGCGTGVDIGALSIENIIAYNTIVDCTNKVMVDSSVTLDNWIIGWDIINSGGTGGIRTSASQAFPSGACVQGSTHQRSSGTSTGFYVCQNSAWVGK